MCSYNFGEGNKTAQFGSLCYYQTMLGLAAGVFAFVTSVLDIKGGKLTSF